jgi:tetratricopeptide (TPR) repeat protein
MRTSQLPKQRLVSRGQGRPRLAWPLLVLVLVSPLPAAAAEDPVAPYRALREAVQAEFRTTGRPDVARLAPAMSALQALAARTNGEPQVQALLELGRMQRLRNDFAASTMTLARAGELAEARGFGQAAFDAWIGVARAHMIGTRDHGAAAATFERAVDAAGRAPSAKQRYELASYQAQLLDTRGEVEAALVQALSALRLATDDGDRFFAEHDAAAALSKLVANCLHRRLHDRRSTAEGGGIGACRRATAAAEAGYGRTEEIAAGLGWRGVLPMIADQRRALAMQRWVFEQRAAMDPVRMAANVGLPRAFAPRERADVLVNRNFAGGQVLAADERRLGDMMEQLVMRSEAVSGRRGARELALLDTAAGLRQGSMRSGPALLEQAAQLLLTERGSFFDPRRRGTSIESSPEILRELGLRLLSLGREAEAFAAFEAGRARGLGELAQVLARPDITAADREWLAALLTLDARASEIETGLVAEFIAAEGGEAPPRDRLEELYRIRAERRAKLRDPGSPQARLASVAYEPAGLEALRAAAAASGVPVLLYWSEPTNVVAWYVGPRGSEVHAVLLPQELLASKVERVVDSARRPGKFDAEAARELYLYLVAPFERLLDGGRIMIVPQGSLVSLPFETLIEPRSGAPLIERRAVSYAPNATMAVAALRRTPRRLAGMAAVVDTRIDDDTGEMAGIEAAGMRPRIDRTGAATPASLPQALAGAEIAHVLLHGVFNPDEPLMSRLHFPAPRNAQLLASELVGLPLRGVRLAVFSACEGGRVGTTLANEFYGFPWALLAGGAETVVLSRWQVSGASNGVWMRHFYRSIAAGSAPAQAAAEAMRAMRRAGHTHPYHWAAMQVSGG